MTTLELTGTIEHKGFGRGVWALVTATDTYELHKAPPELQQVGLNVKITGTIRPDIMTIAMIGPVLAVESFVVL